MIKVGQLNRLKVIKEVTFGVYLEGGSWGEILLPKKFLPAGTKMHDSLEVFIYFDSEDKIIATTQRPFAKVDSCAFLKVSDVNRFGAFLDWGLDKDLLVPKSEQQRPMEKGKSYIVYVRQDRDGRIVASSKLDYYLDKAPADFKQTDKVNLLIAETTLLGTKVIINDTHWGLIYASDIFQTLDYGSKVIGYIKTLRDDGKIDVSLRKTGQDNIQDLAKRILAHLHKEKGFLALHDKSPYSDIQQMFGESKKSFKAAIGYLYKQGEISLEAEGIRLRDKKNKDNFK
ncbi:MAG: GntR family transcriptional regulator [Tatlockia sp.]|nr:GntR family transcriptional regulator [Tatlockia sp.]